MTLVVSRAPAEVLLFNWLQSYREWWLMFPCPDLQTDVRWHRTWQMHAELTLMSRLPPIMTGAGVSASLRLRRKQC